MARLRGVGVEFSSPTGNVVALSDVSLDVEPASSTAIVGRSGSGKSTLVSVLALMRRPSRGEVLIEGDLVSRMSAAAVSALRARRVGIVFQSFHLEPALTARENVLLPWTFHSRQEARRTARRRADELLGLLEIADLRDRRPSHMSGGQRQRVAIARALFPRPALFIADEPTGNLDEDTAGAICQVMYSLPEQTGAAVMVVTHDRAVAGLARRTLELRRGNVFEFEGTDP